MTDPFAQASANGASTPAAANGGAVMDDPFAKPSDIKTGDYPKFEELVGKLLAIQPTLSEKVPSMNNDGKMVTRITADVTVIDRSDPASSRTYQDMYISNAIVYKLEPLISTRGLLLGSPYRGKSKLTPAGVETPEQVEAALVKNPRMSFAWLMHDPTPEDHAAAMTWYRSRQSR